MPVDSSSIVSSSKCSSVESVTGAAGGGGGRLRSTGSEVLLEMTRGRIGLGSNRATLSSSVAGSASSLSWDRVAVVRRGGNAGAYGGGAGGVLSPGGGGGFFFEIEGTVARAGDAFWI
jgi:hypothetical protein